MQVDFSIGAQWSEVDPPAQASREIPTEPRHRHLDIDCFDTACLHRHAIDRPPLRWRRGRATPGEQYGCAVRLDDLAMPQGGSFTVATHGFVRCRFGNPERHTQYMADAGMMGCRFLSIGEHDSILGTARYDADYHRRWSQPAGAQPIEIVAHAGWLLVVSSTIWQGAAPLGTVAAACGAGEDSCLYYLRYWRQ